MNTDPLLLTLFLIFTGAALLSTAALYTRQSLLVAYIVLGAILGPSGLHLVSDPFIVQRVGEMGMVFLLFLLGLNLHPQKLVQMLKNVTWVGTLSSLIFIVVSCIVCRVVGFTMTESILVGVALMFSSTIIGLKLLPTTILHHQHTGEVMISVLLLQDILAIVVLVFLNGTPFGSFSWHSVGILLLSLPTLLAFAFVVQRYVLMKLFMKFDRIREYVFLLAIGWCLGLAQLAHCVGLSEEIGAFIGGVALAASPISLYIAESLKPLRDFFLVMFFFAIGAAFNFQEAHSILIPASILAILMLVIKPLVFTYLLSWIGETKTVAKEVGFRLGQASEFSILIATLALNTSLISLHVSYLIQATTIFTFIVSSYIVVLAYPTPLALTDKMRKD